MKKKHQGGRKQTNKLKDDQKPKKGMSADLPDIQSQVSTKYSLVQMGCRWAGGGGWVGGWGYYVS